MPYHIETWDKPDHQHRRQELRAAHLEYLNGVADLILAAGAKLNEDGSDAGGGVYIIDVNERAAAERFIASDPFHQGGLFREVRITRWRKAFLGGKCLI